MFCPQCGKENVDGARFCESCGAALDAVAPNAIETANPFAVGSQTSNATNGGYNGDAPIVPSNVFSAWKMVFSKYFDGKGRASRTEFWYWQIFLFLVIGIPALFLYGKLDSMGFHGETFVESDSALPFPPSVIGAIAWILIWAIIVFCPNINLLVRRVHDFNTTGWLVLLPFVFSKLSGIVQLVFGFIPGTKGPNKYGPKPMKR